MGIGFSGNANLCRTRISLAIPFRSRPSILETVLDLPAHYREIEIALKKAVFDDLDLVISSGSTNTLVAKANLLNTATATTYLAFDVDADDITAEDDDHLDGPKIGAPSRGRADRAGPA